VKGEISEVLQRQHVGQLTQSIHNSSTIELNDAYFAPPSAVSSATSKTTADIDESAEASSLVERR
jgi:hypothetical protein